MVAVVDAHALIWMLEGNAQLGANARRVLEDPQAKLILPAIALAEACWVVRKGKTAIDDWRDVVRHVTLDARFEIVPLDRELVARSLTLPDSLEMHDGQIIATALRLAESDSSVVLLSCDLSIVSSGLVRTVW